jgi:hypothetical protein
VHHFGFAELISTTLLKKSSDIKFNENPRFNDSYKRTQKRRDGVSLICAVRWHKCAYKENYYAYWETDFNPVFYKIKGMTRIKTKKQNNGKNMQPVPVKGCNYKAELLWMD